MGAMFLLDPFYLNINGEGALECLELYQYLRGIHPQFVYIQEEIMGKCRVGACMTMQPKVRRTTYMFNKVVLPFCKVHRSQGRQLVS